MPPGPPPPLSAVEIAALGGHVVMGSVRTPSTSPAWALLVETSVPGTKSLSGWLGSGQRSTFARAGSKVGLNNIGTRNLSPWRIGLNLPWLQRGDVEFDLLFGKA
jgi:hypothetical protein